MPAVSVCMPSFRGERFLPDSLGSLAEQSWQDWELVLVEDGSRDGTEAMVRTFAVQHEQPVTYLRNERNLGAPAARDRAIRESRGEYVAMLDADDRWSPDHLRTGMDVISRTGADVAFAAATKCDAHSGRLLGYMWPTSKELESLPTALFQRSFLIPTELLFRRQALFDVGLHDHKVRYCNDLDLWFRMLRAGKRFEFTGKASCEYRQHDAAITARKVAEMLVYRAFVYERNRDWDAVPLHVRRRRRGLAWFRAGLHMLPRDLHLGLRYLVQALRARAGLSSLDLSLVSWE